jgi:hypothetical protein
MEAKVLEYITILGGIGLLIGAAGWVMSRPGPTVRHTHAVAVRHTKPAGLEIVYQSRSVGACTRYRAQHKRLGEALVVMTRADVDAENLAAVNNPEFWRDVRRLSAGTPAAVAGLARDATVLADRLATTAQRISSMVQDESLTKIDGIPLGPVMEPQDGRQGTRKRAHRPPGQ